VISTQASRRGVGFHSLRALVFAVYGFLFLPIIAVVILSFGENVSVFRVSGWSLKWYRELWSNSDITSALGFSIQVGVASALFATVIGTAAAFVLVRQRFFGRNFVRAALFSPIIVPEIIIAVALLSFLVLLRVPRGIGSLIIGHTLLILPYVISIVSARLYGFDRRLEEAAKNLGAPPWRALAEVTIPLIMPAIVAGVLIGFKVSFDEVVGSLFWSSVRQQTLPVTVFAMVRYELTPQVNAIGTLMIAISLGALATYELAMYRPVHKVSEAVTKTPHAD
jgi:spermidine/putrescine transport system permease protein